ncbi:MAG: hypothetical protein A4E70_02303 [Syntrophus sp. PtaU1.Bin005]|jgi:hypothetical protein|nr:MAG: hypothetical protein A4E69_03251 [Syntrophus sp. PtaB.Bin138]OPY78855.1 MAG: hypothetical protein A4E70_02303 [Syntrophus sp. PtaU1.Bin005]
MKRLLDLAEVRITQHDKSVHVIDSGEMKIHEPLAATSRY